MALKQLVSVWLKENIDCTNGKSLIAVKSSKKELFLATGLHLQLGRAALESLGELEIKGLQLTLMKNGGWMVPCSYLPAARE